MLYYVAATRGKHGCNSGIMVTGSHNPKDYNGFKMVLRGAAVYGDADPGPEAAASSPRTTPPATAAWARWTSSPSTPSASSGTPSCRAPMKVVVDSGNGIPGATAPAILRALGCEVVEHLLEGGRRLPQPPSGPVARPENLEDLKRIVRATDAELGLAFDGDGDRLGVVTKDGTIIYPGPPADAVRRGHPDAPPGRADHLRRQVHAAPGAVDPSSTAASR